MTDPIPSGPAGPTPSDPRPARPAGVVVVGVLAILVALLLLLSGVMGFAVWKLALQDEVAQPQHMPRGFEPMEWMMDHFAWISGGQAVVGVVLLAVAVGFLRLRPWGLAGLRGFAWLFLVFMLVYTVLFLWVWFGASGEIAAGPEGADPQLQVFRWLGLAGGVFAMLFWMTPVGLLLWYLGRPEIEGAFPAR